MAPARMRPAAALAAFTLLVWTTRIRNIWSDDGLETAGRIGRTALSLSFTAFAIATLWAWWQTRRDGEAPAGTGLLVRLFAAWTIGVWAIRAVQIASADHGAAFVAVHTALAVASTVLAVWAVRSLQPSPEPART